MLYLLQFFVGYYSLQFKIYTIYSGIYSDVSCAQRYNFSEGTAEGPQWLWNVVGYEDIKVKFFM